MGVGYGVMNGRRIIPESWIRDFRENGDAAVWDRGNFAADMPGHHYRSKGYTDLKDPHRPSYGIGIHGQSVFFDAVSGVVCAKHSTHPAPVDPKLFDDMFRAFKAIAHALSD